jgi:hypothetical protein
MYQEIEDCLTEGQCELCGGSLKCPLDDKIFNFYADFTNENDYSSCIFISEVKRN